MKSRMSHSRLGIVVGVDGSLPAKAAVAWAARDAALRNVPVTLVHIVTPAGPGATPPFKLRGRSDSRFNEDRPHRVIEEAHRIAVEATSSSRPPQITSDVFYASVVPTLVDLSNRADMVVVGYRTSGVFPHALLRSVSYHLVRHAHCPVSVIDDGGALTTRGPHAPVVVGIDGAPTSELATAIGFDEASRRGVGLVALHAWSNPGRLDVGHPHQASIECASLEAREEEVLAERLAGWQERYPDVVVDKEVVSDRPVHRLLKHAETAQLLVVGSRGRGPATSALLGSVSWAVIGSAQIPVIVARTPDQQDAVSGSRPNKPEPMPTHMGRSA